MKDSFYTTERNVQIVLSLLKSYGIHKVIASPGTTNVTLVASMQSDPWFEMYSSLDERSAAYMACGMVAESGEPVVLTCTGATASRNYYPGLTEAFYRKLPVLAITATQDPARIGHCVPQVIDRSRCANDVAVFSTHVQFIEKKSDEWNVILKVNQAMHALFAKGGGPVHLNLETRYTRDFTVKTLPPCRVIEYINACGKFPNLPEGKIGIFVGSHRPMNSELTDAIDCFCASNNAVVFCDHSSNYHGNFRVFNSLVGAQDFYASRVCRCSLIIHIGEVTAGYELMRWGYMGQRQWRVSEDGRTCDTFQRLSAVFEMPEEYFFRHYTKEQLAAGERTFLTDCLNEVKNMQAKMPELPFSNLWIAQQTAHRLPENSCLHLGILNTVRTWNFYDTPKSVQCFCNSGGFGIDGIVSAFIGSSLASPEKLHYCVVGDLAFFYDLNSMGNRHVGNNARILLINNGRGAEFRSPYHFCYQFGDEADIYMAAANHFNRCSSHEFVKSFAEALGYEYLRATNKEEYLNVLDHFLATDDLSHPIILEACTEISDENFAIKAARNVMTTNMSGPIHTTKEIIHRLIPKSILNAIK